MEERGNETSRVKAATSSPDIQELDATKKPVGVYLAAAYGEKFKSLESVRTGLAAALGTYAASQDSIRAGVAAALGTHSVSQEGVRTGLAAALGTYAASQDSIRAGVAAALGTHSVSQEGVRTGLAAALGTYASLQNIFATSWNATYVEHLSVFTGAGKLLAQRIAYDAIADTIPEDPQWHDEFNKWISDNFWVIIGWSIASIMALLLFLISASAPELEADYDTLTRSPITIISLALSVYALTKQKKD